MDITMNRVPYEENGTTKPASIFRVTTYEYQYYLPKKIHYPSFRLRTANTAFLPTLEEAEEWVAHKGSFYRHINKDNKPSSYYGTYAYVITEIPLRIDTNLDYYGISLSECVYSPDGTLWGKRNYCNIIPDNCFSPEEYNYWGRLCMFEGRKPEEIKFKPGDIVEVLGYPGNFYWSSNRVDLAIVVKCPPTVSEMSEKLQQYRATHSGFDLCDHALSIEFGSREDEYEVLSLACEEIDLSPTIATLRPSMPVSTRMRNRLQKVYQQYMDKMDENKKQEGNGK